MFLRRLPALLAVLLLGALTLRLGLSFPVVLTGALVLIVLLYIPRAGIQTALAPLLALSALAWMALAGYRIHQRLAFGEPWLRLALILLAVAGFTAWSAWLLRPRR